MPRKLTVSTVSKDDVETDNKTVQETEKPKRGRTKKLETTERVKTVEAVGTTEHVETVEKVNVQEKQESEQPTLDNQENQDSDGWDEEVIAPTVVRQTTHSQSQSFSASSASNVSKPPTRHSGRENRFSHDNSRQDNTRYNTNTRPKSTALAFSYNDYKNFNQPATDCSTPELLRVLIVRAHEDGQVHLKRCLETTLRAVNLECKFPTLPPPRRPVNNI